MRKGQRSDAPELKEIRMSEHNNPTENKIDRGTPDLKLEKTTPLKITESASTSELLRQMSNTAFTGRSLGEAADVMEQMLRDDECFKILTLSGAMTMAGLGDLIRESIQRGWVNCIVSTGALVGHGMVEDLGLTHYKADPRITDEEYFKLKLNRVYDTLEPEENLDELEEVVRRAFDRLFEEVEGRPVCTAEILNFLGREIGGEGILQDAVKANVPVIIPAFTDSELGLDFAVHNLFRTINKQAPLVYDAFGDLDLFREICEGAVAEEQRLGIFTIGGGVPRNWAQQVGPYIDVRNTRLKLSTPRIRFTYGVRVCPDPVHYGHLSGCTYSEGVSWGKFVPPAEGGHFAEVLLDATVGWPLLVRTMIERGL